MRPQYCFVFLESSVSFMNAIKGIMLKKEIMASEGEICFYYPYLVFTKVFYDHFGANKPLWGIGFSVNAISKNNIFKNMSADERKKAEENQEELFCVRVKADTLVFSELRYEYNEVFAVVPNLNALNMTCIQGLKAGTKYKQWWWKALRGDCCYMKNDDEITKYLNDYRFYRDNRVIPIENKVFPCVNLLGEKNTPYKLLSKSPKQLCEGNRTQNNGWFPEGLF